MPRNMNVALVSMGLLLGTMGCDSFLTDVSTDPNNPAKATIQTLLVGVQGAQFAFQEGTVPMMLCEWMQACGATNGRYVEQAGRYDYGAGSNIAANGTDWALIYTGGGLIDMDTIAGMARAAGDSLYLGIDLVWKAFALGSATSLWGSIPYSQIRTSRTPALDPQLVLYDTVQAMLGHAIHLLGSGITTLAAPPDLVFSGNAAKWTGVANTLKARYWMHLAEAAATRPELGQPYDSALKYAALGIADPSGASDFRAFHSGSGYPQSNMWFQFQDNSSFGGDLEAGKTLVDYMNARGDPRRADYFCLLVDGTWAKGHKYKVGDQVGSPDGDANGNVEKVSAVTGDATSGTTEPTWPTTVGATTTDNNVTWTNAGFNFAGDDFNTPQANVSSFGCEPLRFSAKFRVPFVTYQENELIQAEANYALANEPLARTHLNNAYGVVPGLASVAGTATGPALLDSIMMEKYVDMFQNIEGLMDYRRTCIPALTPVTPNLLGVNAVPGELLYPQTERNANPNIPAQSQEVNAGLRTPVDVNACPAAVP